MTRKPVLGRLWGVVASVVTLVLLMGVVACKQERGTCLTPKIASLNVVTVRFASDTSRTATDTVLPNAVWIAQATPTPVATQYGASSAFTLSLSGVADSCNWLMTTDSLGKQSVDTLRFYYKRSTYFISNACGFGSQFVLDSVRSTRHNIDSIHIQETSVTNNVKPKHLKVFIHPSF